MKVLYSSCFDNGYFLDYSLPENQSMFEVKICGPQGLLELLERLSGHSGNYMNSSERKLEYHSVLKRYFDEHDSIFANSFNNDPLGVSSELLRYRDQLILAGWDKNSGDVSKKIDTLRDIEGAFDIPPGKEDRYQVVIKALSEPGFKSGINEIEIFEESQEIHPFYQELFNILGENGTKISFHNISEIQREDSPLSELKNLLLSENNNLRLGNNLQEAFQILRFRTDIEAAHFFAVQDLNNPGTAVINSDNRIFDNVLNTFGNPCGGSIQHDANTITTQLFKLSASLFTSPLSIYNYMAYLQSPVHPLPPSLRYAILKDIARSGGLDIELMNGRIQDFEFQDDKERELKSLFIIPQMRDGNEIELTSIRTFYKGLSDWASTQVFGNDRIDDEIKKQLHQLKSLCDLLLKALDNLKKDTISQKDFLRLISDIYEPSNVRLEKAEVGSAYLISAPGQIIDHTDMTLWLDFFDNEIKPGWYDFLSGSEIDKLESDGKRIWRKESQASAAIKQCIQAVMKTENRLCLVVMEKAGDENCSPHPFYSLLKAKIRNLEDFEIPVAFPDACEINGWINPVRDEVERIALPQKLNEHQINGGERIAQRDIESFSSVDTLIQYPFDWVFQYGLHIKPGYTYELGEVETTMGNVAHNYIHDLFESQEYKLEDINNRMEIAYQEDIDEAIVKHGAILLLEENKFDHSRMLSQLKASLQALLKLISENNLKLIASEIHLEETLAGQGGQHFQGEVDLLLEDSTGEQVIIDLKWARKLKKYADKLKEGKAVQLALYNELVRTSRNKAVGKTAYFLLADAKLLSTYEFTGEDAIHIKSDANDDDVGIRTRNSITYRRGQLASGVIEDGEEMDLGDSKYCTDEGYENRISLDSDSTGKKKKNYYSNFQVFKGNYR